VPVIMLLDPARESDPVVARSAENILSAKL
jgi:hypothetical protein